MTETALTKTELQPLIDLAARKRGLTSRVARRLSELTRERFTRQQVDRWLTHDPARRVEPRLAVGLKLLEIQVECLKQDRLDALDWSTFNPDCCIDPKEVQAWADAIKQDTEGMAQRMFPDHIAAIAATKLIGKYCALKAAAMRHRLDGNINGALDLESICERHYKHLPQWAKW